ncbi:Membrane protease YdiL, CAAX protease family [Rubritalea squalenifaciens DSM 18772]|uniref:Membrane protease YdiL, CAAX protease family n=1 Tax=Rubritalea squalenifaciens DSM 18772 TaxID=1123071 RepID=A0A1M6LGB9_9BACT|nr:type II CAAX endopeptidase family protein [Rubritalea squalenifaciens]SHJ70216.1 Membrane protease YdiL, CAAX protease family [Rubritalea squalenifaciens DSM 18772]
MSWAPRQSPPSSSPPDERQLPSTIGLVKKWLLALIVLIVLPVWGFETFIAWYYQRSPDQQTAVYIQSFSHSEIQLAEAASRMELGDTTRWILSISSQEQAVGRAIVLLEQYNEEYPKEAAYEGADLYLASLYLRAGQQEKAIEIARKSKSPYADIIFSLARNHPLNQSQLAAIEEHQDRYPHYSEAGFWYTLHLDLPGNSPIDDSLNDILDTDNADRKLLFRAISIGFCYTCLAIGLIYVLFNIRTLDRLQPSAIEPGIIAGLFMFLLLEYASTYTYLYLHKICLYILQLSDQASFVIADALYRIVPVTAALIYLHFCKRKDSCSPLRSFKLTIPAVSLCLGIGIFSYFFLHRYLAPHRIGDYITGLEGIGSASSKPLIFIYSIIASVIIAPFTEELLFRGILLTALRRKLGTFIALFFTSLLFSLVHVQGFTDSIHVFIMGMLLGLAYLKSRTLWPSIIAHAGFNAWLYFETWNVYLAN